MLWGTGKPVKVDVKMEGGELRKSQGKKKFDAAEYYRHSQRFNFSQDKKSVLPEDEKTRGPGADLKQ